MRLDDGQGWWLVGPKGGVRVGLGPEVEQGIGSLVAVGEAGRSVAHHLALLDDDPQPGLPQGVRPEVDAGKVHARGRQPGVDVDGAERAARCAGEDPHRVTRLEVDDAGQGREDGVDEVGRGVFAGGERNSVCVELLLDELERRGVGRRVDGLFVNGGGVGVVVRTLCGVVKGPRRVGAEPSRGQGEEF